MWVNKEIQDWKDYITIPREQRPEKCHGRNLKGKQIVNKYPTMQYDWTKRANLCKSETSQWWDRYFPKKPEQKYKIWRGN